VSSPARSVYLRMSCSQVHDVSKCHLEQELVLHDPLHGLDEQVAEGELVAELALDVGEELLQVLLAHEVLALRLVLTVHHVHVQPTLLQLIIN